MKMKNKLKIRAEKILAFYITVSVVISGLLLISENGSCLSENIGIQDRSSATVAKPDLTISSSDISFSPSSPKAGESVTINGKIYNIGSASATSYTISLYDGDPDNSGDLVNTYTTIFTSGDFPPYSYREESIEWTAVEGTHEIYFVIEDVHPSESNTWNNKASKTISVGPSVFSTTILPLIVGTVIIIIIIYVVFRVCRGVMKKKREVIGYDKQHLPPASSEPCVSSTPSSSYAATTYTSKPIILWPILRKVGMTSFIIYGIANLIISIGIVVGVGTLLAQGMCLSASTYTGLYIAINVLGIIIGILFIVMGPAFARQKLGRLPFVGLLLYAIMWILGGVEYIIYSNLPFMADFLTPGILLIVGSALLICAGAIFLSRSSQVKAVGGILGIVSFCLLIASYASTPTCAAAFGGDTEITQLGIGYIRLAGMLIGGVGALLFALLQRKKGVEISYILITIGILIFGIGTVVSSAFFVTGFRWDLYSEIANTVRIFLILECIGGYIMIVAGCLIITSACLGLAAITGSLLSTTPIVPIPAKDRADLSKDELERDLTLLDHRFSRGEISEETYKELKKKYEERLKSKQEGAFPTAGTIPGPPTPQPSQPQYTIHDKNLQDNWIKRIIAAIIDGVILGVIVWIITSLFFYGRGFWGGSLWGGSLIFGVLWLIYSAFLEGTRGATIGKQLLKLGVVATSGNMDISKAFIRNISKIFWVLLLIDVAIGFATEGDRRQRFLDRYANTVVVKEGESPQYMSPSLPPQSYPPFQSPPSKVTIQCPSCGRTGKVDSSFHGQLQCPACHTLFEVWEESEEGKLPARPPQIPWFYSCWERILLITVVIIIIIVCFILTLR